MVTENDERTRNNSPGISLFEIAKEKKLRKTPRHCVTYIQLEGTSYLERMIHSQVERPYVVQKRNGMVYSRMFQEEEGIIRQSIVERSLEDLWKAH